MRIKDTMTCADGASTKSPKKEAIQGMDLSKDEMSGYFYPVVVDHPWIRHRVVDRKNGIPTYWQI
ncbi:hypothetical protein NXX56_15480 [Bacteroides thetaiotaomicron]|nr:hypothetical protein [Bacteroides thetaiotaomicron]